MGGCDWDRDDGSAVLTSEPVLRAIRRLAQRSARYSRALAHDAGLSAPQVRCLRAVAELPPEHCTVAQVAEHAALSLPTASRLLTRLVDVGDLRREYAPRDRRKVFLALTAQGEAKLQGPLSTLQERFEERFRQLGEAERKQLLASVQLLVELLEEADPE